MKKKFPKIKLAFQKYFLVILLLMGISGYINAQNISLTQPCNNLDFPLAEQAAETTISTSGTWAIPSITAINTGGADFTMSITSITERNAFNFPTVNSCIPCSNPKTIKGIIFTASGHDFTITGTPDATSALFSYEVVVTATTKGEPALTCSRTYTFSIAAAGSHDGEPHVTTVDGVKYDFQSIGEFVLLRGDNSGDFEIQTRQIPYATQSPGDYSNTGLSVCVSINTAVAARVGNHRVTYQPNIIDGKQDQKGMQLRVDGTLTTLGENGLDLGSGGRIVKLSGNGIEIDFPNGTSLVVTGSWLSDRSLWFLNLSVYRTIATKGIMGVVGDSSWLPRLPDGTSLGFRPGDMGQRFVQLYKTFADAWRVDTTTSLFDYESGTSTTTFSNPPWPLENAQSCSLTGQTPLPPISLQVAQQLCLEIVDPNMRAEAIFDVMLTGDSNFVKGYLHTQRVKTGTTETTVKASKDTTKHGEQVTFTANVERKFVRGKDVLTGSVEFTVDGKKLEQVKLDANGTAILTTTSLEVGKHQVAARFIPDAGSTAFSSSSLDMTHIVTGDIPIWQQWWFWVLLILALILIIYLLTRKKKGP